MGRGSSKNKVDGAEIKNTPAGEEQNELNSEPAPKEAKKSLNRAYEEWPVKPKYEDVTDQMGKVLGRKLIDFEKQAQKPLRTTVITEEKAEILNSQSENTGLRLYEIE